MCGESMFKKMKIEVAGAEGDGQSDGRRTSAFMLVERASLYMLACSEGNAPDAARLVLDTVHQGFDDVHVEPHVEDDEAVISASLSLYAGTLASNQLVHDRRRAGEDASVSFVGVTLRGGSLGIARAGEARVSRIGRRGVEHLVDGSRPETDVLALGLLPKSAVRPFTGAWELGDVLVLAGNQVVDGLGAKLVARTVLETKNLGDAARELADGRGAVVLIRWVR